MPDLIGAGTDKPRILQPGQVVEIDAELARKIVVVCAKMLEEAIPQIVEAAAAEAVRRMEGEEGGEDDAADAEGAAGL